MIKMTIKLYDIWKATEEALQKNVVPWLIKIKVRWNILKNKIPKAGIDKVIDKQI